MKEMFAVFIAKPFVRDAQVLAPEKLPDELYKKKRLNENDVLAYAEKNDDCWQDCEGGLIVDFVLASSDQEAISKVKKYDKRVLGAFCTKDRPGVSGVIRCGNCVYCKYDGFDHVCTENTRTIKTELDGFCSKAKKKQ